MKLINNNLFQGMSETEINNCLECSKSQMLDYQKNQIIFNQLDTPDYLYVLLEGSIAICKDNLSGKRGIVTTFEQSGDIFGEVYLFLENQEYDYYALAIKNAQILKIPKSFFYYRCPKNCDYHAKLTQNMLGILAQKAYYLNQKLQLLSSGSLKQKIVKFLLDNVNQKNVVMMTMNREEFADFLNVTRPSLSRELLAMNKSGLIIINNKSIIIPDLNILESFL